MPDELPTQPTPEPAAIPVAPPSVTATTTTPIAPTGTGLTPNVAAGLAMIFTVIGGIIMLVVEKRERFVRFWAMQAIFFGVAWFVFSIVSGIVGAIFGSISSILGWMWALVNALGHLAFLAVWIISCVQAFSMKEWEIPLVGKLARQQLDKVPPTTVV